LTPNIWALPFPSSNRLIIVVKKEKKLESEKAPYPVEFCNPAPYDDIHSIQADHSNGFEKQRTPWPFAGREHTAKASTT
jgi:hypothetical protein